MGHIKFVGRLQLCKAIYHICDNPQLRGPKNSTKIWITEDFQLTLMLDIELSGLLARHIDNGIKFLELRSH